MTAPEPTETADSRPAEVPASAAGLAGPRTLARVLALLNPRRRRIRWPLKIAIALSITTLVLYPRPNLLVRNIIHWSRLDLLIEPEEPGLAPLEAAVRARLGPDADAAEALRIVEDVVYQAIPYAWDWDTWGVADYVPTVAQTLRAGQEDCDGRAVVAASLLARLGYEARLMSDLGHVWVWTPHGQTMSPSEPAGGEVFVQQGESGSTLNWAAVFNLRALAIDWPRNIAYGIAVFPAGREMILLAAAWLLALGRRPNRALAAIGLALLIVGLLTIRWKCKDFWSPTIAYAWIGFGCIGAGIAASWFSDLRRGRRRDVPVPPTTVQTPEIGPSGTNQA